MRRTETCAVDSQLPGFRQCSVLVYSELSYIPARGAFDYECPVIIGYYIVRGTDLVCLVHRSTVCIQVIDRYKVSVGCFGTHVDSGQDFRFPVRTCGVIPVCLFTGYSQCRYGTGCDDQISCFHNGMFLNDFVFSFHFLVCLPYPVLPFQCSETYFRCQRPPGKRVVEVSHFR